MQPPYAAFLFQDLNQAQNPVDHLAASVPTPPSIGLAVYFSGFNLTAKLDQVIGLLHHFAPHCVWLHLNFTGAAN